MEKLNPAPAVTETVPEVTEITTIAQPVIVEKTEPQIVLQETSTPELQVV